MSSDIQSRLERLRRSGELAGSRKDLGRPDAAPRTPFLFPGEEREGETKAGRCYLRELRIPLSETHGDIPLKALLDCRGADLALPGKNPDLAELQPGRSLFLDIETTGLCGGTGTWVFLIGAGWVEGDFFILRQYFLRHPREEKAMLLHFTAVAERFTDMISFNGRAFDLPLVQTRQILAGMPRPTEPRRHLDLLPCSRSLWKRRLESCSLRSLEEALLGLRRHGDIPGEEIPAVYFNYLRRGTTGRLREVFRHNVLDILSMVALTARVARTAAETAVEHPADYYALGKLHASAGNAAKAEACLKAAARCGQPPLAQAALLDLSFLYKRQGRQAEAAALWRRLIEEGSLDLTPYVELAKHCEHRTGELETALALTRQALELARRRPPRPPSDQISLPALRHRLARLQRRLTP